MKKNSVFGFTARVLCNVSEALYMSKEFRRTF